MLQQAKPAEPISQGRDLDEVRRALIARAADLVVALRGQPNPKIKCKGELRYGTRGSFSAIVNGPKAGLWRDHETGDSGDLFSLIMRERRCAFPEALKFARDFCGIRVMPRAAASPPRRSVSDQDDAARIKAALNIFDGGGSIGHPVAKRYFEHRSLIPPADDGRVLRFSARCPFGRGEHHPAIIALYRGILDDEPRAISRIALTPEGKKIDRKMLGPIGGTACKLSPDEDVTLGLHINEGIETGLAAMALGFVPLWALGSAGAIASFPLFEGDPTLGFELTLTIICDNDKPNPKTGRMPGQDAALACSDRWTLAGQEVRRVVPTMLGEDMNDIIKRRERGDA